jgi:hypothetical protein
MPTPFMHLRVSEEMRALAASKPDLDGRLRELLESEWPAFYLGSVAPDYQSIYGLPRADTHFYRMPPESRDQSLQAMHARYPRLWPGRDQRPDQAAFVAAYLVHLQLDLDWHYDVVEPLFAQTTLADDPHNAYLVHLILLTYLDHIARETLPEMAATTLAAAAPDHWLPFASDEQLAGWRDFLVRQLEPGAMSQTVQIYAGRLRMTPEEFAAKLHSPEWMREELFSRVPVPSIQQQMQTAVPRCLDLVEAYWRGDADTWGSN